MEIIDRFDATVHRALSLQYYRTAFSEAGARIGGGRFNRIGEGALYLGLSPTGAVAEYLRGGLPRPLVIVSATVAIDHVVDLRGDLSHWPDYWRDWACDWQHARDDRLVDPTVECSSWICRDAVLNQNCSGVLYPSRQATGETNLAIFVEASVAGAVTIQIVDPLGEMRRANPVKL